MEEARQHPAVDADGSQTERLQVFLLLQREQRACACARGAPGKKAKFWLGDTTLADNAGFAQHELNEIAGHISVHPSAFTTSGENTLASESFALSGARVTGTYLIAELSDGREIATPLAWYPRLGQCELAVLQDFEVSPWGLYWPAIDEDISLEGILAGKRGVATRPD